MTESNAIAVLQIIRRNYVLRSQEAVALNEAIDALSERITNREAIDTSTCPCCGAFLGEQDDWD